MESISEYIKEFFPDREKSPQEKVTEFVKENPQIVYKGVPFIIGVYYALPLLVLSWQWLPWIYVAYEVNKKANIAWMKK